MKIDAYPLQWPMGWKRTKTRKKSQFKTTFGRARDNVFHELKLMGVGNCNVIMSTNLPLRRDGLPYAGMANPTDPGIAVYFRYKDKFMVLACDQYHKVEENVHAVAKTIEAMRGIERWGTSDMMERSFTGFQALPPPKNSWFDILEVHEKASAEEIRTAWREKAKLYHPDQGGSDEMMAKINQAYSEGMKQNEKR